MVNRTYPINYSEMWAKTGGIRIKAHTSATFAREVILIEEALIAEMTSMEVHC